MFEPTTRRSFDVALSRSRHFFTNCAGVGVDRDCSPLACNQTVEEICKAQLQCSLKVLLVRTATLLELLFRRCAVRFESSFRGLCQRTTEYGSARSVCVCVFMFSFCGKAKTPTMLYGVYSLQLRYNSGASMTFALTVSAKSGCNQHSLGVGCNLVAEQPDGYRLDETPLTTCTEVESHV